MKEKELVFGAILSYVQMILNALISLFYTPYLLSALGKSEYGLYSTVSATISLIGLINLGLGNGYLRYYSRYDIAGNQKAKDKLNGLYLLIFTVLSVFALIVGLIISNNLSWIFKNGLTGEEYVIAKRLSLVLSFNIAVSLLTTVFNSIITAHERFIIPKIVGIISTLIAPAVTIPLLLLGIRSIALVSVSLATSIVSGISLAVYVLVVLKEKFILNGFEKKLVKDLLIYTLPIAVNLLVEQVNLNIDKILIGRYKGTGEVAVYNIGYTLFALYMTISTSVSSVFTPRIHAIVNKNMDNKAQLRDNLTCLFIKVGRIQCELLVLVITGLIFFGMPFITAFWTGTEYTNSYYVLLLLAIPATIPFIQNLGVEIQRAENLHQFRSIIYGAMAVLNFIMSIYLCQKYGAVGCAVGTAISYVLCNGLIMNVFYHRRCNINIIEFWRSIFQILVSVTPAIVVWLLIKRFFDLTILPMFILGIAVYTVMYCTSLWFIGMNNEEKGIVKDFLSTAKRVLVRK